MLDVLDVGEVREVLDVGEPGTYRGLRQPSELSRSLSGANRALGGPPGTWGGAQGTSGPQGSGMGVPTPERGKSMMMSHLCNLPWRRVTHITLGPLQGGTLLVRWE